MEALRRQIDYQRWKHESQLLEKLGRNLAWEAIRRWPGLRGEDKLAWQYLWHESEAGHQQIYVNATMIAADQGTSSDAGRKRIKNLAAEGLITTVDRRGGRWLIELPDPLAIARARRIDFDGQLTFEFIEQPSSDELPATSAPHDDDLATSASRDGDTAGGLSLYRVAEEPPEDPPEEAPELPPEEPRRATLTSTSRRDLSQTLTSLTSEQQEKSEVRGKVEVRGRASSGVSSADEEGPRPVGESIRRFPSLAKQEQRKADLTAEIMDRVGCVKMRRSAAAKVASAIVEGKIPDAELTVLLAKIDELRSAGKLQSASAYFNGAMRKIKSRYGA